MNTSFTKTEIQPDPCHAEPFINHQAMNASTTDRLFIGIFPAGIAYADRHREEHGDYKRVAFLPFASLVLKPSRNASPELLQAAREHAATIQARKGERFTVSGCGQYIILGE